MLPKPTTPSEECEGGPGPDETRKQPLYIGCLYASEGSSEARGPTTSCKMILPEEAIKVE